MFYDKSVEQYPGYSIDTLLEAVSKLESRFVKYTFYESSRFRPETEKAVDDIRLIKPQARGSVVASGGDTMPISGSKKLNLRNTAVILVKETNGSVHDSKPVYVFPCKVGEKYYGVSEGLSFLKKNLPHLVDLSGEMEETIASLLRSSPERLEPGLAFGSAEEPISTGKADLIFRDVTGTKMIVEVERNATDSTIGQIIRLSAGYERDHGLGAGAVRSSIVCFRISDNVLAAANRAKIEVWRLVDGSFTKISKTS